MQIIPIRDMRDTNALSERCRNSREPIFITKNGYGDMVVMSMETYERSIGKLELYQKLAEAEDDLANGRTVDGEAFFADLLKEYPKDV